MLLIILLMLIGIAAGFFAVSRDASGKILKYTGKIQGAATSILLFSMGIWLGGNGDFWRNIATTGLHGLLFAVATIIGSMAAVYFLSKPFRKKGGKL